MSGETMGWWGCLSCGQHVSDNHTGSCPVCGEQIGRVLPAAAAVHARRDALAEGNPRVEVTLRRLSGLNGLFSNTHAGHAIPY